MTNEELRNNWTDAFIALVMNEASAAAMDLSSEDEREAIVQALQDAIEFFSTPEFGTEIPE
jgi:hypothetical protein